MIRKSGLHLPSTAQKSEKYQFVQNTNLGIAFKTTTTLHHLIKTIAPTLLQEHEKSGIYKNYVQELPQSLCWADQSKLRIKIPGTHTVH